MIRRRPGPSEPKPEAPLKKPFEYGPRANVNAAGLIFATVDRVCAILRELKIPKDDHRFLDALELSGRCLAVGGTVHDAVAAVRNYLGLPPESDAPQPEPPRLDTNETRVAQTVQEVLAAASTGILELSEEEIAAEVARQRRTLAQWCEDNPWEEEDLPMDDAAPPREGLPYPIAGDLFEEGK